MIVLSKHAKDRMAERGIRKEHIEKILENPDYAGRAFDDKLIAHKKIMGKCIEIVYVVKDNKITIITCYYC